MARLPKLKARYDESYLMTARQVRRDSYQQWHDRISEIDSIIRGEFPGQAPSKYTNGKPAVMNLADQMPRDVARLGSETTPSYTAKPLGDTLDHEKNAYTRSIIAEGYFHFGNFDILRPQLLMDMVIAGAAFVACYVSPTSEYPAMMRVDPRNAYPSMFNGVLQDLLTVTPMPIRLADRLFPELQLMKKFEKSEGDMDDYVEIMDLFAPEECVKAVGVRSVGGDPMDARVVQVKPYNLDVPPAGFYQVPSPDGAIRGLLDQVGGSLAAKDKIIKDVLEYSNQMVYSPWEESGIINATDPPGVNTIYRHDPSATNPSFMRRVPPAQSSPQLFGIVEFLDQEQRGQIGYPTTRQGDVGVSQGSAAFVQSTQGQLTSMVRECQRGLTSIQQQVARASFQLDREALDFAKPLLRAQGKKKTYKPSSDITSDIIYVAYGAGAGLDRQATDVRLLQYHGAKAISVQKMLEETDFVGDVETELDRIEREQLRDIIFQRFAGDPTTSMDFLIMVQDLMYEDGLSLTQAMSAAQEQQSAMAEAAQAEGMAPPEGAAVAEPGADQAALAAGATPTGAPAIPGAFRPPPLEQIFVK